MMICNTKYWISLSYHSMPLAAYQLKTLMLDFSNLQLAAVRMIPWAKANLNYTAQALIISAGMISTY